MAAMADHLSLLLLDPLYCQEQQWEPEEDEDEPPPPPPPLSAAEWAEFLSSLSAKEREIHPQNINPDSPYLASARRSSVDWVSGAAAGHGFSAATAALAVSYLDSCFLGGGAVIMPADKPWIWRLSSVACLFLAAKVEETRVPLLLDLQAAAGEENGGGFLFEARTVKRMELLVLSALGWRMNPVTPLSFVHHVLPELVKGPAAARQREVVRRCEDALLSVIADRRWVLYPPSVMAGAALLHALGMNPELGGAALSLLNLTKERVGDCYQLISESICNVKIKRKRLFSCIGEGHVCCYSASPPSPNGVIGSCFSCESSGDSWGLWPSSVSSSPVHRGFKRPKCGDVAGDGEDGD